MLVLPHEPDERLRVGRPVFGEALEVFKGRAHSQTAEDRDRVFCVLVEIRVEDALVHKVGHTIDGKEDPTKIVKFEGRQTIRHCSHCFLERLGIFVQSWLAAGNNLRDQREPVARRSLGKDRAVLTLFQVIGLFFCWLLLVR